MLGKTVTLAKWAGVVALAAALFGCGSASRSKPNTVADQATTERLQKDVSAALKGVQWGTGYEKAVATAKQEKRPLMVDVMADWCDACKRLDADVFSRPDVSAAAARFVAVKVDGDKRPELKKKFEVSGYPTIIFLSPDEKEIGRVRGAVPYQLMLSGIEDAAQKAYAK